MTLPRISVFPTCFFGKDSLIHWKTRDYSEAEIFSHSNLEKYEKSLNLKPTNTYRYPKCNDFSPKPTDSGICHTFNGLELKNILTDTKWLKSFQNNFKSTGNTIVRKADGIELEHGFTFTVGKNLYYWHIAYYQ